MSTDCNPLHPPRPFSVWESEVFGKTTDVLIVGAGITGLATACALLTHEPTLDVKVVDETIAPSGASTRNAGFACAGSIGELLDDMKTRSEQEVWDLVAQRWEGLQLLMSLIPPPKLSYNQTGGAELFRDKRAYEQALDYLPKANEFACEITGEREAFVKDTINGFDAIYNRLEGMLHSGLLIELMEHRATLMGASLRRGYRVTNITTGAAEIEGIGEIKADKIVLATNGFSRLLDESLPITPARGYVMVTGPVASQPWEGTFHYDRGYVYFRNFQNNKLLIGGYRNLDPETEATTRHGINPVIKRGLTDLVRTQLLPEWNGIIEHEWTGIMGIGPDKMPVIEEVQPNVLLTAGLSGMGVALGSYIGQQAAGRLIGM